MRFELFYLSLSRSLLFQELTCGVHIHFQIRDLPGPKTILLTNFENYAPDSTTIIFILDITVNYFRIFIY